MSWLIKIIGGKWIYLVLYGLLATSIVGAHHFYKKAIENELAYKSAQANVEYYANNIVTLNSEYQRGRNFQDDLTKPFQGHDLEAIAKAKPDTVSRLINESRDKLFTILEAEGQFTP